MAYNHKVSMGIKVGGKIYATNSEHTTANFTERLDSGRATLTVAVVDNRTKPPVSQVDSEIKSISKLTPVQQLEVLQKMISKRNINEWMELNTKQFAQKIHKKGISDKWIYREKGIERGVFFDHKDGMTAVFMLGPNFLFDIKNSIEEEIPIIRKPIRLDELKDVYINDIDGKTVTVTFEKVIKFMKTH